MNYSVESGDTLGKIAKKFLGDETLWREIWSANPSIKNPDIIHVGQLLKIPFQSQALPEPVQVASVQAKPAATASAPASTTPQERVGAAALKVPLLALAGLGAAYALFKKD